MAAERLDDRGGKGRSERSTPRDRGPRDSSEALAASEALRRGLDPSAARRLASERLRSTGACASRRAIVRRSGTRPERSERAPRTERVFTDRAPRTDRSSARNAHFTKGANPARGNEAVVSFFNDAKGFGFASDDKGDDLFIHFSNIVGDGFKSLAQGQKITFEEARDPRAVRRATYASSAVRERRR